MYEAPCSLILLADTWVNSYVGDKVEPAPKRPIDKFKNSSLSSLALVPSVNPSTRFAHWINLSFAIPQGVVVIGDNRKLKGKERDLVLMWRDFCNRDDLLVFWVSEKKGLDCFLSRAVQPRIIRDCGRME
jgi:hypothetical protein